MGMQVMVGLPGETLADLRETVSAMIALAPRFIRIYPLVVIEDTRLFERFKEGGLFPGQSGRSRYEGVLCLRERLEPCHQDDQDGPHGERGHQGEDRLRPLSSGFRLSGKVGGLLPCCPEGLRRDGCLQGAWPSLSVRAMCPILSATGAPTWIGSGKRVSRSSGR